jgi:hypothetical protein
MAGVMPRDVTAAMLPKISELFPAAANWYPVETHLVTSWRHDNTTALSIISYWYKTADVSAERTVGKKAFYRINSLCRRPPPLGTRSSEEYQHIIFHFWSLVLRKVLLRFFNSV